jgi:hypothetical protein
VVSRNFHALSTAKIAWIDDLGPHVIFTLTNKSCTIASEPPHHQRPVTTLSLSRTTTKVANTHSLSTSGCLEEEYRSTEGYVSFTGFRFLSRPLPFILAFLPSFLRTLLGFCGLTSLSHFLFPPVGTHTHTLGSHHSRSRRWDRVPLGVGCF